jgi:hypothetical protein
MSDRQEVISAFLDDELFDPQELATALADPSGRALLIDLVALRHIVQPDVVASADVSTSRRDRRIRAVGVAAALVLALGGGYLVGQSRSGEVAPDAPAPTRIVEGPAAWQAPLPGSAR